MRSNRIWNRVAGFIQQLRCESLSQKNMVQMPEQQRIKKELEKARIVVEEQMNHMEETERRVIQEWIEYLEDDASLEAQQAIMEIPMSFATFFIPTSIPSPSYLISGLLCFICVNFKYFSAIHIYNCVCHFRNIQIVRYHYDRKTIFLLKFTYIIKNLSSCLFV